MNRKRLLSLVTLCFAGFFTFGTVVSEVLEGESRSVDTAILLWMRDPSNQADLWGPGWFQEAMRDITGLGGIVVLVGISVCAAVYLFVKHRGGLALYVLASVVTGLLFSILLKMEFNRPRPDLVPHDSFVSTASLPSGHALMSAVVYLTLGALLAEAQKQRILKIMIMGLATLITILVGTSRVYLGVHWPSDVLAGWLAGMSWALMFWLLLHYVRAERV